MEDPNWHSRPRWMRNLMTITTRFVPGFMVVFLGFGIVGGIMVPETERTNVYQKYGTTPSRRALSENVVIVDFEELANLDLPAEADTDGRFQQGQQIEQGK